ncbi:hypothetical protein I3400192H8_03690 [Dialister sp. i34-0019-2H8]
MANMTQTVGSDMPMTPVNNSSKTFSQFSMNTSYIEIMNWDYVKSDRRLELVRDGSWDVQSLDSVGKLRLNEKLEMRNAKWWCGARSFDSVLTVPPLHYRTFDISLRSG